MPGNGSETLGINLTVVDASDRFLNALAGVEVCFLPINMFQFAQTYLRNQDPEKKRKIVGNEFIHVFEDQAHRLAQSEEGAKGAFYCRPSVRGNKPPGACI